MRKNFHLFSNRRAFAMRKSNLIKWSDFGNCRRTRKISPSNPILNQKSCCGLSRHIWTVLVVGGQCWHRFTKFARNLFLFPIARRLDTHQEAQPYPGKKPVFRIRDAESSSSTIRDWLVAPLAQTPCYCSCV